MMNSKKWYQSIGMLAGVLLIGLGVYHYTQSQDIEKALEIIAIGMGILGVRRARTSIDKLDPFK